MIAAVRAPGSGRPLLPSLDERRSVAPAQTRLARLALLGVALAYVVVHAFVVGLDRPINWDEAVHLTQVVPGRAAVFMEPHRTRGVSLLVAPIAVFDPSMSVLRTYLVVVTGAGLFAAFATWIRLVGMAAPLAAALFASFWVTVFYSVEVLPNLPTALLAVAVTGLVARLVAGCDDRRGPVLVAAGLLGIMALVRPPDAALLGGGLAVALVALRPAAARWSVAALAGGGLAGLLPWFVEGWVRFGFSPLRTATSAGEYSVGGQRFNQLPLYLHSLEDQLRCAGGCLEEWRTAADGWQLPPARTSLFLLAAVVVVLVAVAIVPATRRTLLVLIAASVPLVLFYGLTGGAMNLRYLFPVFALGALTTAVGVTAAWSVLPRSVFGTALRVVMATALVAVVSWQVTAGVERLERPATRDRAAVLGQALATQVDGQPCVVATAVNYPQLQYWSGCRALELDRGHDGELQAPIGEAGSYVDAAVAAAAGDRVFAVAPVDQPESSPVASWRELPVSHDLADDYRLLEWRAGDPLPPPPCPDEVGGAERRLAEVLSADC